MGRIVLAMMHHHTTPIGLALAFVPFANALPILFSDPSRPDDDIFRTNYTGFGKHKGGISQRVILIRHGEKPSKGDDLSEAGRKRAECLVNHFKGAGITNLYAYTDKSSRRSVETLTPFAESQHLQIDTQTGRDDTSGLAKRLADLSEDAVALVCWEHSVISEIAKALGVSHPGSYDGYDAEWTVQNGKISKGFEH